jgi:hypothetical protein
MINNSLGRHHPASAHPVIISARQWRARPGVAGGDLDTGDGVMSLPNSQVLAAAVSRQVTTPPGGPGHNA